MSKRKKRDGPPEPRRLTVVRYVDPTGKRCKSSDPAAKKVTERTDTYYADIPPASGGRPVRVSLETTDHGQAWVELRKRLRETELRKVGLDSKAIEQAGRPLEEHVEEWARSVQDKGTSGKQAGTIKADMLALARIAKWQHLADITEDTCQAALARLQATPGRGASKRYGSRSAQTRNHYLKHAKQFTRWASSPKRSPRRLLTDPLAELKPIGTDDDRRHDRRSPSDEEVALLFEFLAGPDCPSRCKMTGPQRGLAYKVAMATGFRALEVRSLSRASFDLTAATVTVRAGYSKRRRADVQGLPPWLVVEVGAWFEAQPNGMPWEGFHPKWPGRLLRDDLAGARAAWLDSATTPAERASRETSAVLLYEAPGENGPLFFDFHALRHWFCTWAANLPGISPRTLLALTRHSSTELALKVYAKAQQAQVRKAVEGLPNPSPGPQPEKPTDQGPTASGSG